ncbi:MAG: hypothetical protein PHP64_06690 [Actinomycetota bacterium]|nr:hypothetical protein [Actinomycetota bacterium]
MKKPDDNESAEGKTTNESKTVVDFLNQDDSFFWMESCEGAVPLESIGIELPLGCRFCI